MADNDGNPPDSTDPRYQRPSQIKPVAPAPRVNPPNINTAKEAPAAGGPPGFGDFLEWMRSQPGGGNAAPSEGQRTLIPKEKKKFQRRDAEAKADKTATPPEEGFEEPATPPLPTQEKPPSTAPESGTTVRDLPESSAPELDRTPKGASTSGGLAEPSTPRVRRAQNASAKRNSWVGLAIQIGVLALLILSFLVGRASVNKTVAAPAAAPAAPEVLNKDGKPTTILLSETNSTLIDQAMAAEQLSDFKKASELLEKVKASGERVHGLAFQMAQLAVFANENNRAVVLLNEALNEGDELSKAYNLRATLGSKINMLRGGGMNDYETATKIDPFDAQSFFYWAGALRRTGKPQAALVRSRQALDRLREPTAEGLYRLVIRLTQIELGQDQEFAEEMRKQMALSNPGMDWLFTAAALATRDGKLAEAASYLTRAEQCGDPDGFSLRLRDYYFAQHQYAKEMAPFFNKMKPARPGSMPAPPAPAEKPSAEGAAPPAIGLDVPTLPPPASPGATVSR